MRRLRFAVPATLFTLLVVPALHAEPVNVNTADAETLAAALYGVGEKTASAIVEYREEHGPFDSVEELLQVKGIGPGTLKRNRKDIFLNDKDLDDGSVEASAAD